MLYPVVFFYLLELYEHNPLADVRGTAQVFNIVLFELLVWGLFFVTGSTRIAIRIVCAGTMLFGLVNHYVMAFRSTPFVPWDILSVRTAASVAGNYDFAPGIRVTVITLLFIALFVAAPKVCWKSDKKVVFVYRGLAFAVSAFLLVVFAGRLQDRQFQVRNGLYPHLFTPAHMTKVNGMTVTFVMDMAYMNLDKPSGYDKEQCEELLLDAQAQNNSQMGHRPNVIVIMDEAFSDISVLGDFSPSQDYMPFVHSLMEGADNTVTGNLYVSVCGGNTANTEYEFLTGNTMAFLPAGSVPYQQYIHGEIPSVARQLANMGYATYAMHPYYATGWSRDVVYPRMGFFRSLFREDMKNLSYIRTYASDASDFENIKYLLEEKGEGPAFLFNVTMQNHGSYSDTYANFRPDITVEGVDSVALSQYLSLLRLTDANLEELLAWLAEYKEDTVVIFFGDHQPSDAVTKYISKVQGQSDSDYYYSKGIEEVEQQENLRYLVPYVIWANYDIEERTDYDMSANYLAANAFRIAGIPTSTYQDFLLELQQSYPVISSVYTKQEEDTGAELLKVYEGLQYYQMFDWKEWSE